MDSIADRLSDMPCALDSLRETLSNNTWQSITNAFGKRAICSFAFPHVRILKEQVNNHESYVLFLFLCVSLSLRLC